LLDAVEERRPPSAARPKDVPQTINLTPFGGHFGGRGWRCSYHYSGGSGGTGGPTFMVNFNHLYCVTPLNIGKK
jgi:hypothetical protein